MNMDTFLVQTLSIKHHPVSELKNSFKQRYVMGLGEFMCYMSRNDSRAKLVFEVWAHSIIRQIPPSCWQVTENLSNIKAATSLLREGLRFFSMRRTFYWDCLYLASILNPKYRSTTLSFLRRHSGFISRKTLIDVYDNWNNPNFSKIPIQLLNHKKEADNFIRKPLKTILVVATMTAGKSTLLNALTGYKLNKVSATACTNKLCYLFNKPLSDGLIMKMPNGSYKYSYRMDVSSEDEFSEVALHFNSILSDCRVCFIDTPGVNYSRSEQHHKITHQAIENNQYDAILFVSNSNYFGTEDETDLLKFIVKKTNKPVIFVLNKIDTCNPKYDSIAKMAYDFENMLLQFTKRSKVILVSAEAAYYSKLNPAHLDGDELIEYEHYKRKFDNAYYDLPSYYDDRHSKSFMESTGITLIENIIKSLQ